MLPDTHNLLLRRKLVRDLLHARLARHVALYPGHEWAANERSGPCSHMYAAALLGAGVDLVGSLLKHLDPAPGDVHLGSVDGETCGDGCGQSCFGVAGMSMHTFAETSPSTRDQDGLGSVLNQQEAPILQLTLPWTEKMSSSLKVGCSSAIVMEEVW